MTILLSDPRVAAVPLHESGEPLVRLPDAFGPAGALVRSGLASRLELARRALPTGLGLRVLEGHRAPDRQRAIIASYDGEVRRAHPHATPEERHHLVSRFVSPLAVAPHVAGAAVDLTLVDLTTRGGPVALDLGTPVDATPEQSGGLCFTDAPGLAAGPRALRAVMRAALGGAGLVNYPTEWWHWSHGDRYWALATGAPAALHGPVEPTLDLVHTAAVA